LGKQGTPWQFIHTVLGAGTGQFQVRPEVLIAGSQFQCTFIVERGLCDVAQLVMAIPDVVIEIGRNAEFKKRCVVHQGSGMVTGQICLGSSSVQAVRR
jgi:hypothetical protein